MRIRASLEFIFYKAFAELRSEGTRFYASFFWWVIEPAIHMAAFYIVFGLVFKKGGDNYVAFLLSGLVVWKWFASSISSAGNSILAHLGLIRQIYVHKYIFPLTVLVTNTIHFLFIFMVLILFFFISGILPQASWLAVVPLLLVMLLLIAGVSCMVAAIVPIIPDINILIDKFLLFGLFVSGVFFNIEKIPESMRPIFWLNPVAVIIRDLRNAMIHGIWPDMFTMGIITLFSLVLIVLSAWMMLHYDRIYPKVVM